jgi:hypothetical protein
MNDSGPGTIAADSKTILAEVLKHMRVQNEHQVSQLGRGEDIIQQLRSTNRRVNVLVVAAVLLIVLGGIQENRFERIVSEQQAAQLRVMTLEKSVDQKITTGTANVVKKVEELGQSSPRIVTGSDGTFSLSVPITADQTAAPVASAAPRRSGGTPMRSSAPPKAAAPQQRVVKGLAGEQDRVLLPL